MATPTVYLVSGSNKGIGLGLVTQLAARPNVIVFAGARTPSDASALRALASEHRGTFHILQLVSGDEEGNRAAVAELNKIAVRLDVVIANAGIAKHMGPALETPPDEMREHYGVNVIGTLVLFQATYALLSASTPSPKFIPISSSAGSIENGAKAPLKVLAYGASKATGNYLARRLYYEYPILSIWNVYARKEAKADPSQFASPSLRDL